jgi:hypothetical protein
VKDTPTRAFFPGVVVPAILVLLVLFNLVSGKAIYPARHTLVTVYTDTYRVAGAIVLEIAFAAGCFAWYFLANDEEHEHLALPIVAVSVLVAAVGLVVVVIGFLE